MQTKLYTLLLLLLTQLAPAQNLVPNPSFEDTVSCPMGANNIGNITDWFSSKFSPDYFHPCADVSVPYMSVPNNFAGHQSPLSGISYTGLATYVANPANNTREIIGVKIKDTLVSGVKYFVSAHISRGKSETADCATNNFGFKFSTIPYYASSNPVVVDNTSQVHVASIITDTLDWVWVGGSFIADSEYTYIMLGNFYDDAHTDTTDCPAVANKAAYYYVDEVCVSVDSSRCAEQAFLGEASPPRLANIFLYPNPAKDILRINNMQGAKPFYLINSLGQRVWESTLHEGINLLDVTVFSNGLYMLVTGNSPSCKFLINH